MFKASINEKQCNDVLQMLEIATKAGGISVARVAIPIVDDLVSQVTKYNETLQPAQPKDSGEPLAVVQ